MLIVLSIPLWLIPPLVMVLPPLIWGWLTYRVFGYDVLAEHALEDTATQTNIVRPTLDDVKTILAKTYYEGIVLKTVQK